MSNRHLPLIIPRSEAAAYLSHYRLLDLVGQGEFAQVYCAIHRHTGQLVAIKKTRHTPEHTSQEPFVLKHLSHPNVVSAQAILQADMDFHFILEYCESGTLRSVLGGAMPAYDSDAPTPVLSLAETKSFIADILQGLHHIHQSHIIHGDLKPENILLTATCPARASSVPLSLTAKIADFGTARFIEYPTHSRHEIGSPTYAAPERFEGHSTYASDLYAVGIMLYEMLLGDRPFSGNPNMLRQAHQTQPVPLPKTLSFPARRLLLKALHKRPEHRFANAEDMLSAVQQLSAVYSTAPQTTLQTTPQTIPQTTLKSALTPVLSQPRFPAPIERLIDASQGCFIVTETSVHLLTHTGQFSSVAHFSQPSWVAVAPTGQWLISLPKRASLKSTAHYYRLSQRCLRPYPHPKEQQSQAANISIPLNSTLPNNLSPTTLDLLAINNRYLIRITTTAAKTYLECFTRRGQYIGRLSLNLLLRQVSRTAIPYQLVALATTMGSTTPAAMLINLKPFQIRYLHLPVKPEKVAALAWGYAIWGEQKLLLLDRTAMPISFIADTRLTESLREPLLEPAIAAAHSLNHALNIASINAGTSSEALLFAPTDANQQSVLHKADLRKLDLDLVM